MDQIFQTLVSVIAEQQTIINAIASKVEKIESIGGGGGGSASIEDYVSGKLYTRNMLIVDPNTETVYRALKEYTSDSVENDVKNGNLKLVGFESQVVTMNHQPTQSEINALPDAALVATYSTTETPYDPVLTGD